MPADDLRSSHPPPASPASLDDALNIGDLDDPEAVRALWDGLAGSRRLLRPEAEPRPEPAAEPTPPELEPTPPELEPRPEPAAEPSPSGSPGGPATRRDARRARREATERRRSERLVLRRHRVLPRTVIGISFALLAFALGAGLSGAVLYAYYDARLAENEQRIGTLSAGLEERLEAANDELQASSASAIDDLRREAEPLRALIEDAATVSELTTELASSVWFVSTLDENGQPAVGSAFVVASDDTSSLLVTSLSVVGAATTQPAPPVTVRSGEEELEVEVHNWDAERDLALLIVPRGGLEALDWAGDRAVTGLVGKRIYAVGGLGANGASLSPGIVIDQSESGLQHTVPLGQAFRGAPLVNGRGKVVAVASLTYAPLNFPPGDVPFAVPVQAACERVLACSGDVPGRGGG